VLRPLRLAILGSLFWPVPAGSRPLDQGITISLRTRTDLVVCTGFCPHEDITVWPDGAVVVNGTPRRRVAKAEAARFRTILAPFRSTASDSVDPSMVFPNACLLKVQWPAKVHRARPNACGDFMVPTYGQVNAQETNLFSAVQRALAAVHLNISGQATL